MYLLLATIPASALAMIGMAFSIAIFIVLAMYIGSIFFQNPQLNALAKEELFSTVFSGILIIFWLTSDALMNQVAANMVSIAIGGNVQGCTDTTCLSGLYIGHINIALGTLSIMITKLKSLYVDLFLFETLIGFLSSVSFPLGNPTGVIATVTFSISPFAGLGMLSNAHTVIVESISYIITVLWAKEYLLIFARDAVPLFIFPLGLVLRVFPFSRHTGSSIIAFAFVVYFIMPFSMILSNYLIFDLAKPADFSYTPSSVSFFKNTNNLEKEMIDVRSKTSEELFKLYKTENLAEVKATVNECIGGTINHILCSGELMLKNSASDALGFFHKAWEIWTFTMGLTGDFAITAFNNPLMPSGITAGLYYFLVNEVANVSQLIATISISTIIEIIITVTMYANISVAMGGEAEIIGLSKIV